MIKNEILERAKQERVYVFFDMDGVLADYDMTDVKPSDHNNQGFYFSKRPIKTNIRFAKKLSKKKNVKIGILSNCYYPRQKEEKLAWLKLYAPFFKEENIHVIVYETMLIPGQDKKELKNIYLEKMQQNKKMAMFLIDDDIQNLKYINKNKITPVHVSSILK